MPYDEKTADRVRRALFGRPGLEEKKMMGGVCFMVGGHMICGVTRSELLLRVGRDAYAESLAQPHVRPMEMRGRPMSGFVLIDPPGFRTSAALAKWIKRGLDFVTTLPSKDK